MNNEVAATDIRDQFPFVIMGIAIKNIHDISDIDLIECISEQHDCVKGILCLLSSLGSTNELSNEDVGRMVRNMSWILYEAENRIDLVKVYSNELWERYQKLRFPV